MNYFLEHMTIGITPLIAKQLAGYVSQNTRASFLDLKSSAQCVKGECACRPTKSLQVELTTFLNNKKQLTTSVKQYIIDVMGVSSLNSTIFYYTGNIKNDTYVRNSSLPGTTPSDLYHGEEETAFEHAAYHHKHPALGFVLAFFALLTVVGNLLVITAIVKERYLRANTNYFLVSLAVADLVVGSIVMPFSIALEIRSGRWVYGKLWCDLWHSFDVLGSTASILNLCVISMDRYWAITDPIKYPHRMSSRRVCILIALVWICSGSISFPAIMWWRAVDPVLPDTVCLFTEDTAYLLISSAISFYTPLVIMLYVYWKIYRAAAEQLRSLRHGSKSVVSGINGQKLTLRIHRGGARPGATSLLMMNVRKNLSIYTPAIAETNDFSPIKPRYLRNGCHNQSNKRNTTNNNLSIEDDTASVNSAFIENQNENEDDNAPVSDIHSPAKFIRKRLKQFVIKTKLSKVARERKAAKTLGIVIGVFIICWLPFFAANLLYGICGTCVLHPDIIFPVFTWLGYINSGMNPIIYALSLKDFRRAFSRILCVCCPKHQYKIPNKTFSMSTFNLHAGDRPPSDETSSTVANIQAIPLD
ncbi:dopamine receptor 2 isoform X1 [Lingula anatina]|uniref:Dopamine receptor 2 isoform X1 n=1 Tax=Lingula anatina TaxID=7574 RepID=A0A1S3K9Y2_LINAN|nr:dopamine receptor 2 isoform X1 [Lingula anatina]XP_013419307.1 dopamine receptor 2 isoform X1 [Lingula anatina]XP_013419308.1 dopamine receptor 2 isoform X1 [Lingula anatina]|eukprot:XP_013419306.1 dopamine receptor 2 isoform X1 [Lingula anatina]